MKRAIGLACALALCAGTATAADAPDTAAALQWARKTALQPDDLSLLRTVMTRSRIVAFGEAAHGAEDFLQLRNRLIRIGVERFGITAIATETGFAESAAIDAYVQGDGALTPDLVRDVFTFGAPEAMQANRELLEWLHAYNARRDVKRKVHFYGIEMMGRYHRETQAYARPAFDAALAYATARDSAQARTLAASLEPLLTKLTGKGYAAFTAQERDALTLTTADLVRLFERRRVEWATATTRAAFARAFRNARNAQNLDADLRIDGWWGDGTDRNQRDASAAETVQWVLDQEGPEGRVFLFAHDLHVRKCAQLDGKKRFSSLGQNLDIMTRGDLTVIGSAYGARRGGRTDADPDSVNALLGTVGRTSFALNLHALPANGPARRWWTAPQRFGQDVGAQLFAPAECFDALIYVAQPQPAAKLSGQP